MRAFLSLTLPFAMFFSILFAISAARAQSCDFSVTDVEFGNIDSLSGASANATGTISVTCRALLAPILPVRVCLNINAGSGGATSGTRHMRNSANMPLNFNFYHDAVRQIPWGSREQPVFGDPLSLTFTTLLLGIPQTQIVTIYAKAAANQQTASPGFYSSAFSGANISFNYVTSLVLPANCANVTQNTTRPSFVAKANIQPNCLVNAQDIHFGSQGVLDRAIDAAGNLGIRCTPGTTYDVRLNNGLTGDGSTTRRMTRNNEFVTYGLYQDVARSIPFGDSASQLVSGNATGAVQDLPVYGRVPPQQTPSPGTYSDTVVVTVTY